MTDLSNIQSITVIGSTALDTIETPHGRAEEIVGGSAFFVGASASLFAPLNLLGIVGDDFPMAEIEFMHERGVNLDSLVVAEGETFRWSGRYHENMNHRDTLSVSMGVFEGFQPQITGEAANADFLLLANIDPILQLNVLESVNQPKLIALDTMNLWIETQRENVEDLIRRVDLLMLNDEEMSQLTGTHSVLEGGEQLLGMGPKYVVVKKGEHGAMLFTGDSPPFISPAFPLLEPKDPTGAGDSFAGAMMGYLAATGELSPFNFRTALVYGIITASFTVEDFGMKRLQSLTAEDIENRMRKFREMVEF